VRHPLLSIWLGALIIGFSPILIKLGMNRGVHPVAIAFWRVALAFPVFCAWIVWRGKSSGIRPHPRLLLPGSFFAVDMAIWHFSLHYTSVANSTLLANFAAVLVPMGAWLWWGERPGGRFVTGTLLSLAGVGMLVYRSGRGEGAGAYPLLGDLMGLGTAFFYAGFQLSAKSLLARYPPAQVMAWNAGIAALILGPLTWLTGGSLLPPPEGWPPLLALALLCQVAGQGLIIYSFSRLPAGLVSVSLLLQPAGSAVWGWFFFGQALAPLQVIGGGAILVGVVLVQQRSPPYNG
jgi:drug/metabolite transporter (DMT)-like permease